MQACGPNPKLSILIPVFNERDTIVPLIQRLFVSGCDQYEWIFIDDGSTDGTTELLRAHVPPHQKLLHLPENRGKSAAVQAGLCIATGEWIIVQDADLEYDPSQIEQLLPKAESYGSPSVAVYGRRPSCWESPSRWLFALGVLGIDITFWLVYRRWVRDHATCYKLVRQELLEKFELQSSGFEGCVEITAKLMRSGTPIVQVPISYKPRSIGEGKKLTMSYGLTALRSVWKYRNWSVR